MYIYERPDWPRFYWNSERISAHLADVRHKQGRLIGRMEAIGFSLQSEAVLHTLTQDVLTSSEIEGEILDREQVRSSIARRLGMDTSAAVTNRDIESVVEMMLDATQNYSAPLTRERLFSWHASLFPTGYSGIRKIMVAAWRDDSSGPMQVVSGPIGRERVHYEAPSSGRIAAEMNVFLDWYNHDDALDFVLKAGVAHIWFVTIHPFEDGNGRIARAIADMSLARSEKSARRFYSMSAQIRRERDTYYSVLETLQKGTLDISDGLEWFLDCLYRALDNVETTLESVFRKSRLWQSWSGSPFNNRQQKILNRLIDGFEGKLTSSKWARLGKCSQDTALRDIQDLVARGILIKDASGGRSTSYSLADK